MTMKTTKSTIKNDQKNDQKRNETFERPDARTFETGRPWVFQRDPRGTGCPYLLDWTPVGFLTRPWRDRMPVPFRPDARRFFKETFKGLDARRFFNETFKGPDAHTF